MEKIIHQVWVGDYEIPSTYQKCMEKIKSFHIKSGWQYKLWTNDNIHMLNIPLPIQQVLNNFEKNKDYVMQADIIRILALKIYGGIYVDCDYSIENNQTGLAGLDHYDVFITEPDANDTNICNSIFGFASGSNLGNFIYSMLLNDAKNNCVWFGPSWMGQTIRKYYDLDSTASNDTLSKKYKDDTTNNIIKLYLRPEFTNENSKRMRHKLLYSWSPQNKIKFEKKEYENHTSKVSAVMCTYGRFKCAERAINCFINQTYTGPKELIIFNTDVVHEYKLSKEMQEYDIKIINCNTDYVTGKNYTNVGAIRRDALTHATGDYYICWDDDDIFLPWFIQQSMDYIRDNDALSFKPHKSFFKTASKIELAVNTMEASIVSDIKKIREYGFKLETGSEGLGWYNKMVSKHELDTNNHYYIPQYCFNWGDSSDMNPGHKQSGTIDDPNNFNNHKKYTIDYAKRPVKKYDLEKLNEIFEEYFDYILKHRELFNEILFAKYIVPHFGKLYNNIKKIN